jgi:flagellar basal-body rod protein FlgC
MSSMSIPLSGMQAAATQLTATANNTANIDSNGALPAAGRSAGAKHPYQPVRVEQSTGPNGGAATTVRDVKPSYVARYDPSAPYANNQGQVAAPNVDVLNAILDTVTSTASFEANAKAANAVDDMVKQLFELNK